MGLEIERKFLMNSPYVLPDASFQIENIAITQGYLSSDEFKSIRVRVSKYSKEKDGFLITDNMDTVGFITIKFSGKYALSSEEFEFVIPNTQAKELVKLSPHTISKVRKVFDIDGVTVAIDHFVDSCHGLVLVVAEVEFDSEKEALEYRPPFQFIKELTEDVRFTNANLAKLSKDEANELIDEVYGNEETNNDY